MEPRKHLQQVAQSQRTLLKGIFRAELALKKIVDFYSKIKLLCMNRNLFFVFEGAGGRFYIGTKKVCLRFSNIFM